MRLFADDDTERAMQQQPRRLARGFPDSVHPLVEANIGLVGNVIRKYGYQFANLDSDTQFSDGCLALCKAAKYYREDSGVKFSTYATSCIYKNLAQSNAKAKPKAGHESLSSKHDSSGYEAADRDEYSGRWESVEDSMPDAAEEIVLLLRKGKTPRGVVRVMGLESDVERLVEMIASRDDGMFS